MIYTDLGHAIRRESDGASIPKDQENIDYSRALAEVANGTSQIAAKPPLTKPELKDAALTSASALGFTYQQLRVIRAIVLLTAGTAAQKAKATALLGPLVKLAGDARRIADQIDSNQTPDILAPAIIPIDDP